MKLEVPLKLAVGTNRILVLLSNSRESSGVALKDPKPVPVSICHVPPVLDLDVIAMVPTVSPTFAALVISSVIELNKTP